MERRRNLQIFLIGKSGSFRVCDTTPPTCAANGFGMVKVIDFVARKFCGLERRDGPIPNVHSNKCTIEELVC